MERLRVLTSRVLGFFWKRHVEENLDAELRAHLEALTEENIRRGMTREEARYRARREFGGIEQTKDSYREQRGLPFLETLIGDVRFAFRLLSRKPGFTAIVILTLAVGIGGNTAIFSMVHAVLLQPLPYPHASRLAIVWSTFGKEGRAPASGPELTQLRERSRLFEDLAGVWAQSGSLTGQAEPEQVKLGLVTWNFLSLLTRKPQLGRFFVPQEQGPGAARVAIVSDGLWRRRFGADPQTIGTTVRLNGEPCTIVGILPPGFRVVFPEGSSVPPEMDVYIPFPTSLADDPRDQAYIRIIGRLRSGVTFRQAQSEVEGIAAQLRSEFTDFSAQGLAIQVVPLHGDAVRNVRPALLALFAGVGLILLIACANVANLLLSLAGERQREISLRSAIGAGRARVIRQLLTESLLMSGLSGMAALGVGWGALKLLVSLRPVEMERLGSIQLDFSALAFTFFVSAAAGVVFGLTPAISAARVNIVDSLKEGSARLSRGTQSSKSFLVGGEVALGFVLLIGAGLMMRTFALLLQTDPGLVSRNVLTFHVSVSSLKYRTANQAVAFFRALHNNVSALPGVDAVGLASHLPFDDSLPNWYGYYWPEGAPKEEQNTVMADHRSVLPGYFQSLGAAFVAGRDFDQFDVAENRAVAIIDDSIAKKSWPDARAVGKKLNVENGNFVRDSVEVIGVVKHIQYHSLSDPVRGQVYLLYPRAVREHMAFTVKSSLDAATLVPRIRQEVAKLDKDIPIYDVSPMEAYVGKARRATRFITMLAGVMAGIAVLLACTGIYGVTSYSVLQRTMEIGIRKALGAELGDVLRMVIREGMVPVVSGILVGLGLSLFITPLISSMLFGVGPTDIATFAATAIFLSSAGLLACVVPARRAMRIDAVVALRFE